MNENFQQKSAELEEIRLFNFKGRSLDIRPLVNGFEICEDLFSSVIYGSLDITDAVDLIQNFPLIGEETLVLKYRTDDKSFDMIEIKARVFQMDNVNIVNDKTKNYQLFFCSEEMFTNRTRLVSKSFRNMNPSDVIKSLMTENVESLKPIEAEDTFGIQTYIAPNIHPFEVIQSMTNRARSKSYVDGASFTFFETRDGFKFKSIESLLVKPPITYTYQPASQVSKSVEESFYVVQDWSIDQNFNVLDNINSGMYGNTTFSFDIQNRKYEVVFYNYFNDADYEKTQHIQSQNPKYKLQTDLFPWRDSVEQSLLKFVPRYSQDQLKDANLGIRYSQMSQFMNGFKIRVQVPGNSNLRAGDMINLDVPSTLIEDNQNLQLNRFISGKYLVSSLRDIVAGKEYSTVLELVKDGFANDHEDMADELFNRINLEDN